MKIDLSTIPETFMRHEHVLNGETVVLVQPSHIGVAWDRNNLIFRSSVWTLDGELVSASFKKFFNDQEQPDIDPLPNDIGNGSLFEKVDGSTAIFSIRRGNLIIRTRGTVDARTNDNGHEFVQLAEKYQVQKILAEIAPNEDVTLLFEITSPLCKIVIDYGPEADLTLIGAVRHADYSYFTQNELDALAIKYQLRRPQRYLFNTLAEMRDAVSAFKGKEGICFYYNGDTCLRKFKGLQYLSLHRMKSDVGSIEKVMDLWFSQGQPQYQDFMEFLEKTFDYEIMVMARGHVSKICGAWKEVEKILHGMRGFLLPMTMMGEPRKIIAQKVLQAYCETSRSSMVFAILDKKPLTVDQKKKLLFQCLK